MPLIAYTAKTLLPGAHIQRPQTAGNLCKGPSIPFEAIAMLGAYQDMYLTRKEVRKYWHRPVYDLLSDLQRREQAETQFAGASYRLTTRKFPGSCQINRGTAFMFVEFDPTHVRYFATYSHYMNLDLAFVRLVPYCIDGTRILDKDIILTIPAKHNHTPFPAALAWHALYATNPRFDFYHHTRIRTKALKDIVKEEEEMEKWELEILVR